MVLFWMAGPALKRHFNQAILLQRHGSAWRCFKAKYRLGIVAKSATRNVCRQGLQLLEMHD
ncbi:MAG: hypothetical protein ACI83P_002318 [Janthinobacterium sp.]|jgi:hypothetical protein